jgi:hypothetical protein
MQLYYDKIEDRDIRKIPQRGKNLEIDPSLRMLSTKSTLAYGVSEHVLKVG